MEQLKEEKGHITDNSKQSSNATKVTSLLVDKAAGAKHDVNRSIYYLLNPKNVIALTKYYDNRVL